MHRSTDLKRGMVSGYEQVKEIRPVGGRVAFDSKSDTLTKHSISFGHVKMVCAASTSQRANRNRAKTCANPGRAFGLSTFGVSCFGGGSNEQPVPRARTVSLAESHSQSR